MKIANKYLIIKEIGHGGMGVVYLAKQLELDREVAVKALHPQTKDGADHVLRFMREARAMAKMKHHGILQVYDVIQEGDTYYIVMEYFNAKSLKDIIADRGAIPISESLLYIKQITAALAYAHRHGIYHRDIKPGNVLIGADGVVKIADFGVATVMDDSQITRTGQLIGSPRYMAPEQAAGGTIDGRSDLFSVGMVLYEMTTRKIPFDGDSSVAIIGKLAYHQDELELDFPQSFPESVKRLIRALIKRDPTQRLQSAEQLNAELRKLITQFPFIGVQKNPGLAQTFDEAGGGYGGIDPSVYEPPKVKKKARPIGAILGTSVAILVLFAAGLAYLKLPKSSRADAVADAEQSGEMQTALPDSGGRSPEEAVEDEDTPVASVAPEKPIHWSVDIDEIRSGSRLASEPEAGEVENTPPPAPESEQRPAISDKPVNWTADLDPTPGPQPMEGAGEIELATVYETRKAKLDARYRDMINAHDRAKKAGANRAARKLYQNALGSKNALDRELKELRTLADNGKHSEAIARLDGLSEQTAMVAKQFDKAGRAAKSNKKVVQIDRLRTSLMAAKQRATGSKQLADEAGASNLATDIFNQAEQQEKLAVEAENQARQFVSERKLDSARKLFQDAIDYLNEAEKAFLNAYRSAKSKS